MHKLFTRKDIEITTFNETFSINSKPRKIYEYLQELTSQDIYVIDVTLLHTKKDNNFTHNHYMIRVLRPVYDVEVKTYHLHDFSKKWDYVRTEIFGYFTSEKQADEIKKEYLEKSNSDVKFEADIRKYSPLNQSV